MAFTTTACLDQPRSISMVPFSINQDEDNNTYHKKMHIIDLFDLQYHQEFSAVDFYVEYRNRVIGSLKRKGDIIKWQNNKVLDDDEHLSPTFEELILANVLSVIDNQLPRHIRDHFCLSGELESLMDYTSDILAGVPTFLTAIHDAVESKSGIDQPIR